MVMCFGGNVPGGCRGKCTESGMRGCVSKECAACFGEATNCVHANCEYACSGIGPILDPFQVPFQAWSDCNHCVKKRCRPDFIKCSGLTLPTISKYMVKEWNNHYWNAKTAATFAELKQ